MKIKFEWVLNVGRIICAVLFVAALLVSSPGKAQSTGKTQSTGIAICDAVIAKWRSCMVNPSVEERQLESSAKGWRDLAAGSGPNSAARLLVTSDCENRMKTEIGRASCRERV